MISQMMEDNSEAQMETDVSSTTADSNEDRQEVTGSSGDVEMVIVVEKVKEESLDKVVEETLSNTEPAKNSETAQDPGDLEMAQDPGDSITSKSLMQSEIQSEDVSETGDLSEKLSDIKDVPSLERHGMSPDNLKVLSSEPTDNSSPKTLVTDNAFEIVSNEVIPASPDEDTEINYLQHTKSDGCVKVKQTEQISAIDDHQYAAKDTSNQNEQTNTILQGDKKQSSELSSTDKIDSTNDITDNKQASKTDESTVALDAIDIDASNDSQTNSELSEKDHNKSISRELKSLINSAKESKIISECTQLTSKTRKSRTAFDNANTSLTSLVEADKIHGRRHSNNSQLSNCSEKSDKAVTKRSMRSQNPEFVNKVKQFLNSVTGKGSKHETEGIISDDDLDDSKSQESHSDSTTSTPKKKKLAEDQTSEKTNKLRLDPYCWRCHWAVEQAANEKAHHPMQCTVCPRSFHFKCLSGTERNKITTDKNWVCPECLLVLHAESSETRSPAMKKITLGALCELLKHALERMMDLNGVEPFLHPVDRAAFPHYDKYVVHPMDLTLMKNNINDGLYGSTEAFIADAQWILHNSIIFNTLQSKLTGGARALVRSCRTEMGEIEACPECYAAAHAHRPTWFTDVCSTPHILLWAKLKGFPHWPAKGMSVNSNGVVDVRFFGAHDRAWIPAKDCYLYSEKDPNNFRTKRQDILDSMQEAEQHIRNISRKYGKFVYPPFKTQFEPSKLAEQLKMMIPSFEGEIRSMVKEKSGSTPHSVSKDKSRSNSKSSKSSINDGDISEGEELRVTPTRKMADGAEIAKEDDDFSISDKSKSMEVDVNLHKNDVSRKRRRSDFEEAVITILDSSSVHGDKRKRLDDTSSEEKADNDAKEKVIAPKDKQTEKLIKLPANLDTDKVKEDEKSSESNETKKGLEVTPTRTPSKPKPLARTSTPKDKDTSKEGFMTPKQRPSRNEKSITVEKDDKSRTLKRRNSKNKSLAGTIEEKSDRNSTKRNDKTIDSSSNSKEKRDYTMQRLKDADSDKSGSQKNAAPAKTGSPKSAKERRQDDDDASLAEISREANTNVISNTSGLPTISCVRSLSVLNDKARTVEVTIETPSESSVFTHTGTEDARNMKEAVNKLQKLRSDDPPLIGRVGVRAFARMTSPNVEQREVEREKESVQIEIKSEPIDDEDRQTEKMDLMNAFKLRPVNPMANLRDVRINKVVISPINTRKSAPKPPEIRVRAKKSFPQPRKPDDGRSELNGKNSMVYIPIQPPITQAPVRNARSVSINGPANATSPRMIAPTNTSTSGTNTTVSILLPQSIPPVSTTSLANTVTSNALGTVPSVGQPTVGQIPTVGQVPTNVHTVPLITSVNGQWTFSLQPVMSVGGVDDSPSPMVNGIAERGSTGPVVTLPAHISALTASPSRSVSATSSASAHATLTPVSTPSSLVNRNETPAELPRLQQRPPLLNPFDANTPMGSVPVPSTAGPLTAKLNQSAVKLTDFFRTLLEDSLEKIDEPSSQLSTVKLQLEQARWRHKQEIEEIKHNHELVLAEMRASFEKEKIRAVNEVRRASQVELEAAVKLAKSKQWCANCSQEAQFYCCWNTSYCDYPCQRAHWSQHYAVCTQQRSQENSSSENGGPPHDSALQPPDLPKTTQAPTLTVGNKLAPLRVFAQDSTNGPKSSIIVSMVEDSSGNQTMKCVGTYKAQAPSQLPPLNINKQISNDESAKKVVTSGGYLIVGAAGANGGNLVTSRRTHTIQYFS